MPVENLPMQTNASSRRQFLTAAAALLPLAGCGPTAPKVVETPVPKAPVPDVIGAQLYTVRNLIPDKAEETIKAIAEMGYKAVELGRADLPKLLPLCKKYNLATPAAHFEYACLTGNWANYGGKPPRAGYNLQAALAEAKKAGIEYFVIPYIAQQDRAGMGMFIRLANQLNQAGEMAAKMGMKVGYHNHAFEFTKYGKFTGFEILLENMDPEKSCIEFDIFWAQVAGNDPAALIRKYPKHIKLVHLKDLRANTPEMRAENVGKEAFQELGAGVINLAAVLESAKRVDVAHYFVEQDQTPGDPLASLKTSFDYLQKMKA
jgi:sugar phosphate isomerase/epimerase